MFVPYSGMHPISKFSCQISGGHVKKRYDMIYGTILTCARETISHPRQVLFFNFI